MRIFSNSNTHVVEEFIKNKLYQENKRALHIVPTMILYRERLLFYKNFLRVKGTSEEIEIKVRQQVALYELNSFLKENVYNTSSTVLSRSESSVIIERLMRQNEATHNEAWLSVIGDINESFNKWESASLSLNHLKTIGTTPQWELVLKLYENYKNYTESHNLMNYGKACYQYVNSFDLSPYDELIIDGAFLPVRPELHFLIERFERAGKNVSMILPVNKDDTQSSYDVVKNVYSNYLPLEQWEQIPSLPSQQFYIQKLKDGLFAKYAPTRTNLDRSFRIYKFDTVEEELEWIVKQVAHLIKTQTARKEEIVIITPNALSMRPVFRELFELYDITTHLPKKSLSRLKEGRGVAHLYKIFADPEEGQTFYITPAIFEEILYSHLFETSDQLIEAYKNIKVFFLDCINFEQWEDITTQLIEIKRSLNSRAYTKYHPLTYVEDCTLKAFKDLIMCIKSVCHKLYELPEYSIPRHLTNLIRILNDTPEIKLADSVKERLINVLQAVSTQERLTLTSIEFGVRVIGLLIENEEGEEDGIPPIHTAEDHFKKGVLVTTPNTVEYAQYKFVFMCRFTQDLYPSTKQFNWLNNESVERLLYGTATKMSFANDLAVQRFYADLNMYYLHTAINTCSQKLIISYASRHEGTELYHSHYLYDLIEPLGMKFTTGLKSLEQYLIDFKVINLESSKAPTTLELLDSSLEEPHLEIELNTRNFTIEDLTIYKYCPRRFYYSHSHPENRIYTQEFQLQLYVIACMYERTVIHMINVENLAQPQNIFFKDNLLYDRLMNNVDTYIAAQEIEFKATFLFSDRTWKTIKLHVRRNMEDLLTVLFKKNPYIMNLTKAQKNSSECSLIYNQTDLKAIQIEDGTITTKRDLILKLNGHEQSYNLTNFQEFLLFTAHNATDEEKEFMEQIKDWYYTQKRNILKGQVSHEIKAVYEGVLQKAFNKNNGCHCHYCPFIELCRER